MRNRMLAAAAVFMLSATVAHAGPLSWAWSQTVSAMNGSGTLFAANKDDPTKGYTFRFDPAHSDDPGPINPPTTPATASIGATSFRYWYQDGYPFNWVPTAAPADPSAGKFRVSITATELTPGASYSSTHDFVGTLAYRDIGGTIVPDVTFDQSRVVLGLNEYDFDIRMESVYNPRLKMLFVGSEWEMRLRGTPPGGEEPSGGGPGNGGGGTPAETPEPGTLILAGVAIAGGIGAWLRKRKAA
jgi:hypothetical protein